MYSIPVAKSRGFEDDPSPGENSYAPTASFRFHLVESVRHERASGGTGRS